MFVDNELSKANPKAAGKLKGAVNHLLRSDRFYMGLIVATEVLLSERNDTAWTDGYRIGFAPAFIESNPIDKLAGVFAHECDHVLGLHPFRIRERDSQLWNIATDYVINRYLTQRGYSLPDGGLMPPEDHDWTAEHWYHWLKENPDKVPQTAGNPCGVIFMPDDGEPAGGKKGKEKGGCTLIGIAASGGNSSGIAEKSIQERIDAIRNAAQTGAAMAEADQASRQCGVGAAGINRILDDLITPQVSWIEETCDFLKNISRTDYSWKRFSAQYLDRGFYLPSLSIETIAPVVFAVDTSGSMDTRALKMAGGAYENMRGILNPEETIIVYCDYAVGKVERIGNSEPITFSPVGGGGTAFSPVFKWIADNVDDGEISGLIYFTDLCCSDYPQEPPDYPVLWISQSRSYSRPPFGRVVTVNDQM